jgi:hypothetical protein
MNDDDFDRVISRKRENVSLNIININFKNIHQTLYVYLLCITKLYFFLLLLAFDHLT